MASDAVVREQLRYLDALLIEAYGDGPRQLQDFAQRWASLAESLRLGKETNTLSEETLNLARAVTRRIMNLAGAFVRLEEVAQRPLAIDSRLEKRILENTDHIQEEDDDSEESEAEELTDDEDASPPNWNFLREWLIRNMAYPFINEQSTYSDVLREGNISRNQLIQWVDFVRKHCGWQRAFRSHANSNIEEMKRLWGIFLNNVSDDALDPSTRLPHRIAQDFSKIRASITHLVDSGMSPWWDSATSLVLQTWSLPRGELTVEEWSSDDSDIESVTYDNEDANEVTNQEMCDLDLEPLSLEVRKISQDETRVIPDHPMTSQAPGIGLAADSFYGRRSKRKIEVAFPGIREGATKCVVSTLPPACLLTTCCSSSDLTSADNLYSNVKRRKLDTLSTYHQPSPSFSLSDNASCQGEDSSETSSITPSSLLTPYSDTATSPSECHTPISSPSSSLKQLSSKKAIPFVLTNTSIPCTESSTSALDDKLILEEQITTASKASNSYIRSHIFYHGCKRKRGPADDEYSSRSSNHSDHSSSVRSSPRRTTKRNTQTAIHSSEPSSSIEHEANDQVQVSFKRRRSNNWNVAEVSRQDRNNASVAISSQSTESLISHDSTSFSGSLSRHDKDDLQVQPSSPTLQEHGVTSLSSNHQSVNHSLDSLLQEIQSNIRPYDQLADDTPGTIPWLEYSLTTGILKNSQSIPRNIDDPGQKPDGFHTDAETPSFYSYTDPCSPRSIIEVQTPSSRFPLSPENDEVARWKQEDDCPTPRSPFPNYPTTAQTARSLPYLSGNGSPYPWG
jgi:hypothetical protein